MATFRNDVMRLEVRCQGNRLVFVAWMRDGQVLVDGIRPWEQELAERIRQHPYHREEPSPEQEAP